MDNLVQKINNLIDNSRKLLLTIISAVIVMIFIRGCINQIFDYQEERDYLQKSLASLYSRIENNPDLASVNMDLNGTIDKIINDAHKQLIGMMHEMELQRIQQDPKGSNKVIKKDRYDFALENVGGRVVSYHDTKLMYECGLLLLLIGKCNKINPPEKMLQRVVEPGEAFCFEGSQGSVTIKLSCPVIIDSMTIEHVDRSMTPASNLSNAPKSISATGMKKKHDLNGYEYGNFTFDPNMLNSQTFYFGPSSEKYQFLKINITENYGDENKTCIYRIQVHGHSDEC